MMDIVRTNLFDNVYLASDDDFVDQCNSHAVTMQGNRVMISATLVQSINTAASDTLTFTLEGSYDGQVWKTNGLGQLVLSLNSDSPPDNSASSTAIDDVDYAFLRLRATLLDNEVVTERLRVLFDADLVMSHQ